MINFLRTNSDNLHFIQLVKLLDNDLAERDGTDHSFYAGFNKIDKIKFAIVAYKEDRPVACGAIKEYSTDRMEVKRMFTIPEYRGMGIATIVLHELEKWTKELGYKTCILETGKRQPEAISVYRKSGYLFIDNYGQYAGVENSVCFEKNL